MGVYLLVEYQVWSANSNIAGGIFAKSTGRTVRGALGGSYFAPKVAVVNDDKCLRSNNNRD